MKCVYHTEIDASAICNHCAKSVCPECLVIVRGEHYCKDCIARKAGGAGHEHSPLVAMVLSFIIGGLGQIYNGQIAKGVLLLFTSWLIIPWIIGIFDAYRVAAKIRSGEIVTRKHFGCLIAVIIATCAFWTFVVVVAILSAIAIPIFMQQKIVARERSLRMTLQTTATMFESYAAQHNGRYPTAVGDLQGTGKPWLPIPGEHKDHNGYRIATELTASHYRILAEPQSCGVTGNKIFILETNGIMTERNCFTEEDSRGV